MLAESQAFGGFSTDDDAAEVPGGVVGFASGQQFKVLLVRELVARVRHVLHHPPTAGRPHRTGDHTRNRLSIEGLISK